MIIWTERMAEWVASNSDGLIVGRITRGYGSGFYKVTEPTKVYGEYITLEKAKAAIESAVNMRFTQ